MIALLLSVFVVSIGATLRVFELGSINPRLFFFKYTLLTLTMLIVGGRNSVTGSLVGVVIITTGSELTRYLPGPSVDLPFLAGFFAGGSRMYFLVLNAGLHDFRPNGILGDWEPDHWLMRRAVGKPAAQTTRSSSS
ncbi:hypothetical protein CM1200mP19_2830 [bacterium]|nr:MAG: hypothetical protein CM1200mP19_2830 [bacterium]